MRGLLFTLMSILCGSLALAAGTIYKWTDESGVVHYSDQSHPNAQKIQLHDAQTYKALPADTAPASAAARTATPPASAPSPYRGCAVVQPQDDAAFANVDALTVVVQTDPVLRPGDQIFVTLDGQPLNGPAATGGTFTISPVDRGTHTLQAVVRGTDGAMMCKAPDVTFHVQQPSLQSPTRTRPH
jgi:hypothetical protein